MIFSKSDQLKSKGKPKKKRDHRKTIENKLDHLVSVICRKQGRCEVCGRTEGVLNAHHFITRSRKGVRWYLPNLICLCVHCHTFNHTFSAHKTPEAFKKFMTDLNGEAWKKDVVERARTHTSWKMKDLELLLEKLSSIDKT